VGEWKMVEDASRRRKVKVMGIKIREG